MVNYISREGDMVDAIAARFFDNQTEADVAAAIYRANPALSAYPVVLPPGVPITLPEVVSPNDKTFVRVWS